MSTAEQLDPELGVRERVLAIATHLFAHKGYGSTSIRQVVERAGVTKPALYYYFGSKEALFLETVQAQIETLAEMIRETLDSEGTVVSRLQAFVDRYVRSAIDNEDGCRLAMTATHPVDKGQPQVDIMSMHLKTIAALAALVHEGVEAGELRADLDSRYAIMSLVGTCNLHLVATMHGQPLDDDLAEKVVQTWVEGVGA